MTDTPEENFRSGLERRASEQLQAAGRPYLYEKVSIQYVKPATHHRYTPDFAVMKKDGSLMFIEMKGLFDSADRKKHLMLKEQHPDKDIRLVFSRASNKIGKASKTTYGKWATDKGIKWADNGVIPQEWLDE